MPKSIQETVEGEEQGKLFFTDSRNVSASLENKGNETEHGHEGRVPWFLRRRPCALEEQNIALR